MSYIIRRAVKGDVEGMHRVLYEASAHLGGPTPTSVIASYITNKRLAVVAVEAGFAPAGKRRALAAMQRTGIVGVQLARFPTRGVCFNTMLAVSKTVRGCGIGGGLMAATIRFLALPGPMQSHKFFLVYPPYNVDVGVLYDAQGWVQEGRLVMHTRAKNDLIIRAWYPLTQAPPKFWHEINPKAPRIDCAPLLKTAGQHAGLLDVEPVDQGRDGQMW